jgi:hypothetical protein
MTPSIDRLLDAEAKLDRSFAAAVVVAILSMGWPVALRAMGLEAQPWVGASIVGLLCACFLGYVWFAYAAMVVAGYVGRSRLVVVSWILLAPIIGTVTPLQLLPRIVVLVSPLSLKFILASELRAEIHERTFSE